MPLGHMLYAMVPLYGDFGERYTILYCSVNLWKQVNQKLAQGFLWPLYGDFGESHNSSVTLNLIVGLGIICPEVL
jgi:hypothetical protein